MAVTNKARINTEKREIMKTETIIINRNGAEQIGRDYFKTIIGSEIIWEKTKAGTTTGIIRESKAGFGSRFYFADKSEPMYLVVEFADGNWAYMPMRFEMVKAEVSA